MKKKIILFGLISIILLISSLNGLKLNLFYPPFTDSELKPSDTYPIIPFKVGVMYWPVDLDPHYAWDSGSFDVIDQICEGLFSYNLSDPTLPIIPNLAISEGIWSSDNLNFTVSLRSDVSFHDGVTFDAFAVKFSFDRLLYLTNLTGAQPYGTTLYGESIIKTLYMSPDGVSILNRTEIVSEYVIKFILNKPYGAFKSLLCFSGSYILSPLSTPAIDYINTISDDLIGTGPFLYDGNIPNIEVNFSAYQDYWRGKANIEKMTFKVIQDSVARHNALLAGDIHFMANVYPEYIDIFKANSNITVLDQGMNSNIIMCLGMNNKLIGPHWRQAISYAIDYDYMIEQLLQNRSVRLKSPLPEGILYANSSFNYATLNITKAREILQNNGIGLGLDINNDTEWIAVAQSGSPLATFNYTYNLGNQFREDFFVLLRYNLEYIGVKVIENGLEWSPYLDLLYNVGGTGWDRLSLFWLGWIADFNDPSNFLNSLMSNTSSYNPAQINDPYLEMLLEQGLSETDPIARETIYDIIQQYLVEDLMPWAWGYSPIVCDAHSTMLSGFQQNSLRKLYFYSCEWNPYEIYEHDLVVSLETPIKPEIGNSYMINATVINNGINDEYDVDLFLYLDGIIVGSTTISSLPVGANETISYMWIPPDYGTYNFTAYAPPVLDETFTENNFLTEIIYVFESQLFDGMYIKHVFSIWSEEYEYSYNSNFTYTPYTSRLYYESWGLEYMGSTMSFTWIVDTLTRVMSGGSFFGDGSHTPAWIFTNTSLYDTIPIAADAEGDHDFYVARDLIYDLPGFGLIEVWELEDLTLPGGIAWYEKSTGILLNGTFLYLQDGELSNYTFDFVDTNVEFTYYEPPSLSLTAPDSASSWETGTSEEITWTSTGTISNVKIELYNNSVFVMEIIASTPNDGSYTWVIPSGLADSTQYQIKISDVSNPATYDYSDYFEIYTLVINSLTITTPTSASSWETGTSEEITWTSTGAISNVKIELYNNSVFVMEIIASTPNDGSYTWVIPSGLADSTQYQIKISDVSNPATYDYSDYFEIKKPPSEGPPFIPGYNLYLLISIICIISVILFKNRFKLIK